MPDGFHGSVVDAGQPAIDGVPCDGPTGSRTLTRDVHGWGDDPSSGNTKGRHFPDIGGIVEVDSKQALGAVPGSGTTPGEVRRLVPSPVRFRGVNGSHRLDVTTVHDPAGSVGQARIPSQSLIASGRAVPGAPVVDGESVAIHHESPEVFSAGNVDMFDRRIGLAGDQVAGDSAHGTLGQDEWLIDQLEVVGVEPGDGGTALALQT